MKRFTILSILLLMLLSGFIQAQTGLITKKLPAPGDFSTGMCTDGTNLYISDRETDLIYCIDSGSGKVLKSIESPAYWPTGLAWDGEHLWCADMRGRTDISEDRDGMIFMIDPADGTVLKTLQAPSSSPMGLAWDGKYLWMTDDRLDKVIQFNPSDGTTINSFKSPAKEPSGITFDGKYLWIADSGTDEIYMVNPENGWVIIIMDAPGGSIHGITAKGESLWAADYYDNTIYEVKIKDRTPYIRKDKTSHKITYRHSVTCFGPGKIKSFDLHLAVPENRHNQEITTQIIYNTPPSEIQTDQWGQKTAHFNFKNMKQGDKSNVDMVVNADTYNVRYFIYPEFVGSLKEIPTEISDKYLVDDEKYQINSEIIRNTVKNVVGDEKNPYMIMRRLHQYLIGHLYYNMDGAWDTAPTVIKNGHGSCSEYTFVFISLCRAAGLPARYVGSVWNRSDEAYLDEVYHRWVEVYLPGYGWIPTDPTHGDRELPRDQAFPIGLVRNSALITTQSGGGSSTLEWTYNSHEHYVTEPKTNLNIIHFADWELSK